MTPKQRARLFTRRCEKDIQLEIRMLHWQGERNRGMPILPDRKSKRRAR